MNLSSIEAKLLALAAAGFGRTLSSFDEVLRATSVIQLDSVNVFQRAHLMPAFSRLGAYDETEFESWAFGPAGTRKVQEYWAHCATLIAPEDWHLFQFRRDENRGRPKFIERLQQHKKLANWLKAELASSGPQLVSDFEHEQNKRKGDWWGWSDVKTVLELLWFQGDLVSDGRTNFSRRYALPEQVGDLPSSNLTRDEQRRELVLRSVRNLGVGTIDDIADYFRFYPSEIKHLLAELVADGSVLETKVEGWRRPGYVVAGVEVPGEVSLGERNVRLLSPFDPLVWRRERTSRIFGFDYLIEIYVPEAKRQFGYYTLPILAGNDLVGRVDLKHERKQGVLDVKSLWKEAGIEKAELAGITAGLKTELKLAAGWIGAQKVNPPQKGNWALGRI